VEKGGARRGEKKADSLRPERGGGRCGVARAHLGEIPGSAPAQSFSPNLKNTHRRPLPPPPPPTPSRPSAFQLWTGRLAMLGFVSSILGEATTAAHGGALAQIGFSVPAPGVTASLLVVFGGLTAASAFRTLYEATSGTMTARDAARWGALFGVRKADLDAQAAAGSALKTVGSDFTSPTSLAAASAAKAAGTPADAVLGGGADAASTADTAAAAAKTGTPPGPSMSLAARADALETAASSGDASWAYAKAVELDNGRAAMFGFFISVFIESITGQGIISQCFGIAKASGLLGAASGF
jgi:hypothetical protein